MATVILNQPSPVIQSMERRAQFKKRDEEPRRYEDGQSYAHNALPYTLEKGISDQIAFYEINTC